MASNPINTTSAGQPGQTPAATQAQSAATTIAVPPATATQNNELTVAADQDAAAKENEEDDDDEDEEYDSDYDSEAESVDWVEKEIDQENKLLIVDGDGNILWHHEESPYTAREADRRATCALTELYASASPAELRKYLKDRGLPDPYPQGVTLRYFYLRLLHRADDTMTFRFLDLPPEMRNLVYVALLTFDDGCLCKDCRLHRVCHPAVLRANKQVYKEAKDVLYAENTVHCNFNVGTDDHQVIGRYTRIHNVEATGYGTRINNVFWGMSHIPQWLHRVQSLDISIDAHGHGGVSNARGFLQGCMLNLASFLLEDHNLKKLQIHVTNHLQLHNHKLPAQSDDEADSVFMAVVLYPLRRVTGLTHVKITGVSRSVARKVVKDMKRRLSKPVFNTVPHLYALRTEALQYLEVARALDPIQHESYRKKQPWQVNYLSDRVEWLLEETQYGVDSDDEDNGEFADSDAETNLRHKMEDLRDCLDNKKFDRFEAKKKKLSDVNTDRQALASKQPWINVDSKDNSSSTDFGRTRKWTSRLIDDYESDSY